MDKLGAFSVAAAWGGLLLGIWNAVRDSLRDRPRLRVYFECVAGTDGRPTKLASLRVSNAGRVNVSPLSVGFIDDDGLRVPCADYGGVPVVVGKHLPELLQPGAAGEIRLTIRAKDAEAAAKWRFAYAETADGEVFRSRRNRRAFAQFAAAAKAAHERAEAH